MKATLILGCVSAASATSSSFRAVTVDLDNGNGYLKTNKDIRTHTQWRPSQRSMANSVKYISDLHFGVRQDGSYCSNGYTGNTCEERVCAYGLSNVASAFTGNGDSVFTPGNLMAKSMAAGYDEGGEHSYTECSSQGVCDRVTGECACFAGYQGKGCRRTSCPNDCSGHGQCLANDKINSQYIGHKSGSEERYSLNTQYWDHSKTMQCLCDRGYTGTDCSERICPHGDDVLTSCSENSATDEQTIFLGAVMTNQAWAGGACTDAQPTPIAVTGKSASGGATAFMPYITLTFTDHFGGSYTTAPIQIQVMDVADDLLDGSEASININHAAATAQAVQKALEALPNHVIPSVQVTGRTETISGAGPGYLVKSRATHTSSSVPATLQKFTQTFSSFTEFGTASVDSKITTLAGFDYEKQSLDTAVDANAIVEWTTDGELNPFITKQTASMGGVPTSNAGKFLGPTQKVDTAKAKAHFYDRRVAVYRMNPAQAASKMKDADSNACTGGSCSFTYLAHNCLFKDIKLTVKFNDKATSGKQNTLQCSNNDQTGARGCSAGTSSMMPARLANVKGVTSTCSVHDNDEEIANGTHEENAQCGNRGSCDTTTGKCNCFSGHTGEACDVQSNFV